MTEKEKNPEKEVQKKVQAVSEAANQQPGKQRTSSLVNMLPTSANASCLIS